jgi:hypothetical protein
MIGIEIINGQVIVTLPKAVLVMTKHGAGGPIAE